MTEPTSSRNIPNQLQYYQKTAADPRQFFFLLKNKAFDREKNVLQI